MQCRQRVECPFHVVDELLPDIPEVISCPMLIVPEFKFYLKKDRVLMAGLLSIRLRETQLSLAAHNSELLGRSPAQVTRSDRPEFINMC